MWTDPRGEAEGDFKPFLDALEKEGFDVSMLRRVSKTTGLKKSGERGKNYYRIATKNIVLGTEHFDKKGNLEFGDEVQTSSVVHELFHAAWHQYYNEYTAVDGPIWNEVLNLKNHILDRGDVMSKRGLSQGEILKLGNEQMAYYADRVTFGYLQVKGMAAHVTSRDGRISKEEYDLLQKTLDERKTDANSTKGYYEAGFLEFMSWTGGMRTTWTITTEQKDFVHKRFIGNSVDITRRSLDEFLEKWGYVRDLANGKEWVTPAQPKK